MRWNDGTSCGMVHKVWSKDGKDMVGKMRKMVDDGMSNTELYRDFTKDLYD